MGLLPRGMDSCGVSPNEGRPNIGGKPAETSVLQSTHEIHTGQCKGYYRFTLTSSRVSIYIYVYIGMVIVV